MQLKKGHSLFLVIIFTCIFACDKKEIVKVDSVTLNSVSVTLSEGERETLIATVSPKDAENKIVVWSTSDSSVATVLNGEITAIKAGVAIITATTVDGGKTASCTVTVKAKTVAVESVTLNKDILELIVGESETLKATISPDDTMNKNITWTSSNPSVATVTDGTITAQTEGTTTITAKTEDGGKTANCTVTVKAETVAVQSVALDKNILGLTVEESETLSVTISPDNATNKNIIWTSSNPSVATVTDGAVTAQKEGISIITVKTEDGGKTASCTVTVKAKTVAVESVTLNKNILELTVGESETLSATISPDNATNKNIIWASSNPSVATVTNGTVKAIKEGTATITAKTEDAGKIAYCQVTVKADPIIANFEIKTFTVSDLTPLAVSISSSFKGFSGIIGKAWKFGICYGNNPNPSISDNVKYIYETVDGTYKLNIDINPNEIYYYRAMAYYDGNYYYGGVLSFTSPQLPLDFQAVDLGLSVKWSNCNLGASATHDDGDYYAWGETETKSVFNTKTYRYYDSNVGTYINIGNDISGTQYDAAHIKLGSRWRMPTYSEVSELYHECIWKDAVYKGKPGYLVTGKNGNSIFVVTVSCTDTSSSKMRYSHFWTSTLDTSNSSGFVYYLNYSYFTVNNTFMAKTTDRVYGLPVRPVYD